MSVLAAAKGTKEASDFLDPAHDSGRRRGGEATS